MSRQLVDVYAAWQAIEPPIVLGQLAFAETNRGAVFSFSYDNTFLKSDFRLLIDPLLTLERGDLYNDIPDKNFRVFLDSCPDRWGRILMQRRAAIQHQRGLRATARLSELDYLLGVHDAYRMGGIRFKQAGTTEFLDNNDESAVPPISSLRELEYAAMQIEHDTHVDSDEYYRWLNMLISPGSSLGGARPKACVMDEETNLWIAKFPNRNDIFNVGAWEMVCYELAIAAGVDMFPSQARQFSAEHHTFLTKRFDRNGKQRIHFSSAMTQLRYYDSEHSEGASYLEIADFISSQGAQTKTDLEQLWRRIVFNIAVSNTDDHLRNHGFLLSNKGWKLSPAYDINPCVGKQGLHLNITESENALNYQLAFDVIGFFRLTASEATAIYDHVLSAIKNWRAVATKVGISRREQTAKQDAFNV